MQSVYHKDASFIFALPRYFVVQYIEGAVFYQLEYLLVLRLLK